MLLQGCRSVMAGLRSTMERISGALLSHTGGDVLSRKELTATGRGAERSENRLVPLGKSSKRSSKEKTLKCTLQSPCMLLLFTPPTLELTTGRESELAAVCAVLYS